MTAVLAARIGLFAMCHHRVACRVSCF